MSKEAEAGYLAHLSSLWTLIRRGDGEAQLAEDIRECMDGCWDDMDSEEQSRCRRASTEQAPNETYTLKERAHLRDAFDAQIFKYIEAFREMDAGQAPLHQTTFESGNADVVAAALGIPAEFLNCEPSTASEVHLQVLQERRAGLVSQIRAPNPCPECMEMRLAEAVVDLESNCIYPPPPEKFDDLPGWVGRNKHKKPHWNQSLVGSLAPIEPRDICVCLHAADQHKWLNDPAPLRSRHLRCTMCDCGHFKERDAS